MKGTWQTTDSGGAGLLLPIVIVAGVVLAAGPVAAAVAELVHAIVVIAITLLSAGAAGLVAIVAWRVHRRRANAKELEVWRDPPPWRPVQTRSEPQPIPLAYPRPIERPREVHLHLHGLSAEDIAAVINRNTR